MANEMIAKFEIPYLQVMDENGSVDSKLMPKLDSKHVKWLHEKMVLGRIFDQKALKLQRQGRMGTYAPVYGQEAQVAWALAAAQEDLFVPAFRENAVYLARGMPPEMIFHYWAGDERGMSIPEKINMFPISITVGAHPLHAVGAALAFKIQKKKNAVLTSFGDGATSEGDCLEAMNFAGALKVPCVFVCQNNQWAISIPVAQQTAAETMAQKAVAFGFEGIKIDGNDVFAVYKAVSEALKKAKAGKGPTLIEFFTYRMGDHTTSDEAKKYRKEEEVKEWEKKDPIARLEKYMKKNKIMTEAAMKKVWDAADKKIEQAVVKFESYPSYNPEEIFNYMYENPTPDLVEQKELALAEWASDEKVKSVKPAGKTVQAKEKGAGVVGELEVAE